MYRDNAIADIARPSGEPRGALLLWHGLGDAERLSLRGLAAALASQGVVVVVPDLLPRSTSPGLIESMHLAKTVSSEAGLSEGSCVLGGWSWGPEALSVHQSRHRFGRRDVFSGSPVDTTERRHSAATRPTRSRCLVLRYCLFTARKIRSIMLTIRLPCTTQYLALDLGRSFFEPTAIMQARSAGDTTRPSKSASRSPARRRSNS